MSSLHISSPTRWQPGNAPVAVIMISLNEAHNMEEVCQNLIGWAQEVFLVDSYSQDDTVEIAQRYGVNVVQRRFRGFGDQWNFALRELPVTALWTMKLDPDERLSDELKVKILEKIRQGDCDGMKINRRWWFMGRPLPIRDKILRIWQTGVCRFAQVTVNEHPIIKGKIGVVDGDLEHYDSPDLDHWFEKQNRYSTAEAITAYKKFPLADTPRLLGTPLQRRMWLKKNFYKFPFRYTLLFLYFWLFQGTWRAGWVGYASACLWSNVYRMIEYKRREIEITGRFPTKRLYGPGKPDNRVQQFD